MQTKYLAYTRTKPPGLLRKTAAVITTAALVGVGLMFSAMLLALVLIAVVTAGVYLWWKTRGLRKQMRNFPPPGANMKQETFSGEVIEGEAIRVDESRGG